jgi:hypothetical protein
MCITEPIYLLGTTVKQRNNLIGYSSAKRAKGRIESLCKITDVTEQNSLSVLPPTIAGEVSHVIFVENRAYLRHNPVTEVNNALYLSVDVQ